MLTLYLKLTCLEEIERYLGNPGKIQNKLHKIKQEKYAMTNDARRRLDINAEFCVDPPVVVITIIHSKSDYKKNNQTS